MADKKIRLKILGITFSQVQAGAYALILAEENGVRRVPIIIGTPEAQSIAIYLEGLKPPRPLTHDLFISLTQALEIPLEEVYIYKYEDGIFYSEMIFERDARQIRIDSRTSDAIAIAIRTQSPIYIKQDILQEVGVIMDEDIFQEEGEAETPTAENAFDSMTLEELKEELNEAINQEDYEKASFLHQLIKKWKI